MRALPVRAAPAPRDTLPAIRPALPGLIQFSPSGAARSLGLYSTGRRYVFLRRKRYGLGLYAAVAGDSSRFARSRAAMPARHRPEILQGAEKPAGTLPAQRLPHHARFSSTSAPN